MGVEKWQFDQRVALPLPAKIGLTLARIREWYNHFRGRVCVSYSGGLDSTVLLHLVRSLYPDVVGIFVDTGLEYPEIRKHVFATENTVVVRPEMSFKEVLKRYGFPVVSKKMAQYIHEVQRSQGYTATKRLRLTGLRSDGSFSPMGKISDKWQYLCKAPFLISDRCCYILKRNPAKRIEREYGAPFIGTRATESNQRLQTYYLEGCNAFRLKRPRSTPLAFWTHDDIWDYIRMYSVPYSDIYRMGYERTGCMFCCFGVHLEKAPNRFQRMKQTHPKKWKYCMDVLGLRAVLEYINVEVE